MSIVLICHMLFSVLPVLLCSKLCSVWFSAPMRTVYARLSLHLPSVLSALFQAMLSGPLFVLVCTLFSSVLFALLCSKVWSGWLSFSCAVFVLVCHLLFSVLPALLWSKLCSVWFSALVCTGSSAWSNALYHAPCSACFLSYPELGCLLSAAPAVLLSAVPCSGLYALGYIALISTLWSGLHCELRCVVSYILALFVLCLALCSVLHSLLGLFSALLSDLLKAVTSSRVIRNSLNELRNSLSAPHSAVRYEPIP